MRPRLTRSLLLLSLALGGCTGGLGSTTPADRLAPLSFTPWVVQGCTVFARGADMKLSSQGQIVENGNVAMQLESAVWLAKPPAASITGVAVPVIVEGVRRNFTLQIPYNPETGAAMLQEDAYLTISYRPLGQTADIDISLPTHQLMLALGAMGRTCPQ